MHIPSPLDQLSRNRALLETAYHIRKTNGLNPKIVNGVIICDPLPYIALTGFFIDDVVVIEGNGDFRHFANMFMEPVVLGAMVLSSRPLRVIYFSNQEDLTYWELFWNANKDELLSSVSGAMDIATFNKWINQ